jgi:AcrR family transcriptional regulator
MALTKHKSASVSKLGRQSDKKDRRIARTSQQIDAAFVELLHWRSYGDIRVSDITRKAGVGRATFYAHYSSKDDLLRSQVMRIVAPMLVTRPDAPCPLDASAFFAHVQTAPKIYKALTGSGAGSAERVVRECLELCVGRSLALREGNSAAAFAGFDIQRAVAIRFVASSLFAVIECFIEGNGSGSPQDLQAIFSNLVGGGLGGSAGI